MSDRQAARWTAELSARLKGRRALANIRAGLQRREYKTRPPEVRAKLKAAAADRLACGEVPNGRAWTAAEAARRTGRTVTAVHKRRRKLKVPDGRRPPR
jgi:hypothetical protein